MANFLGKDDVLAAQNDFQSDITSSIRIEGPRHVTKALYQFDYFLENVCKSILSEAQSSF